jgi:hypothetical protein
MHKQRSWVLGFNFPKVQGHILMWSIGYLLKSRVYFLGFARKCEEKRKREIQKSFH